MTEIEFIPSISQTYSSAIDPDSVAYFLKQAKSYPELNNAVIFHRFDLRQKELMLPLLLDCFDLVVLIPDRGMVMVCSSDRESRANFELQKLQVEFPEWNGCNMYVLSSECTKIDAGIWKDISEIYAPLLPTRNPVSIANIRKFLEESMGIEALPACYPESRNRWLDRRFETIVRDQSDIERAIKTSLHEYGWPIRLHIQGSAGCGKTILAIRFFTDLTKRGEKPLLLCYNHRLGKWLKTSLQGKAGVANTLFSFARKTLINAGLASTVVDDDHMSHLIEVLNTGKLIIALADKFDTLIIDEGQDFRQDWVEALSKYFLKENGDLLFLEDPYQDVVNHHSQPVSLKGVIKYSIKQNFRTPTFIAEYSNRLLQKISAQLSLSAVPDVYGNGNVPGWPVQVHVLSNQAEVEKRLSERITALLAEEVPINEILLLSNCDDQSGPFMGWIWNAKLGRQIYNLKSIPSFELKRYTGKYVGGFKEYENNDNGIYCDSVCKVKGLEEFVVLLVDVIPPEPDAKPSVKEDYMKRLYCSLTRSKARLEIFVERTNRLHTCF